MRFHIEFEGVVLDAASKQPAPTLAKVQPYLDAVMEKLVALEADDAAIGFAATDARVEISVSVDADGFGSAVDAAIAVIRSATGPDPKSSWRIDWTSARAVQDAPAPWDDLAAQA